MSHSYERGQGLGGLGLGRGTGRRVSWVGVDWVGRLGGVELTHCIIYITLILICEY